MQYIQKLIFKKNSYEIWTDSGDHMDILEDTLVRLLLHQGMELTEDFWETIYREDQFSRAKKEALQALRRRKTSGQIRQLLLDQGFLQETIDPLLVYLKDYHLLDDLQYIQDFSKDALHLRKDGPRKIRYKLQQKFLDGDLIDEVLNDLDPDLVLENMQDLIEKKYGQGPFSFKEKGKIFRYLQNKGYPYDLIKEELS